MPKGSLKRKNQKDDDDDEEDEEEVVKDDDDDDADDDDDDKPQKKKAAVKKPSLPPGEAMYDLGGKRKLTFSSYKGQRLVGIREYYDDKKTGEEKPGSKGISLNLEQWEELKSHIQDIDDAIEAYGN